MYFGLKLGLYSLDYYTSFFPLFGLWVPLWYSVDLISLLNSELRTFSCNHANMEKDWPSYLSGDAAQGALISFFPTKKVLCSTKQLDWNGWGSIHSQSWTCHHVFKKFAGPPRDSGRSRTPSDIRQTYFVSI